MRYLFFISIIITAALLVGCSGSKEVTEIKPVIIKPPIIRDTLSPVWNDSLFIAIKLSKGDTVETVKFIPDSSLTQKVRELLKENKNLKSLGHFELKVKPDSIVYIDTTKSVQPAPDYPITSKLGLVLIGMIIGGILTSFIKR